MILMFNSFVYELSLFLILNILNILNTLLRMLRIMIMSCFKT